MTIDLQMKNFIGKKDMVDFRIQIGIGYCCEIYSKQPEHHKKKTFKEEYIEFIERFGVEYERKYLFEF